MPAFVTASQLISGCILQSAGQLGLNAYLSAHRGDYATVPGTVQHTSRPTLTPVTNDRFAQPYLRPLAQSGAPIGLLFRIGVQSVDGLINGTRSGEAYEASAGSRALTGALRELRSTAWAVGLRIRRGGAHGRPRVHLPLDGEGPRAKAPVRRVRELLGAGAGGARAGGRLRPRPPSARGSGRGRR